ncbi:hypothetical protein PIB30_105162, partial [Stylosanthes scabra]|nr:hypothetical protein [Stylosanthes scabra]
MRGRQAQLPSSSSPRIYVEASICVEAIQAQGQVMKTHAEAWTVWKSMLMHGSRRTALEDIKFHAYAWSPTHMRGKQSKTGAE